MRHVPPAVSNMTSAQKPARAASVFILPFFLLLLVSHARAQEPTPVAPAKSGGLEQPFTFDKPNDDDQTGRRVALATDAPSARIIREKKEHHKNINRVLDLMRVMIGVIDERVSQNKSNACNLPREGWVVDSENNVKRMQIGEFQDVCQSRLDSNEAVVGNDKELNKSYVEAAKQVIRDGNDAVFRAQSLVSIIPRTGEWSEKRVALRDWELSDGSQKCEVESFSVFRLNNELYFRAALTNRDVDAFMPDFGRQTVVEYVKEDFSTSIYMIHPNEQDVNINATTLLTKWSGKAGLSSVGTMTFEDNPAAAEALRLNEIAIDQAEDAITPSNIAILALPMVMSLIPVAFLADLNTCATLWYIIFTDVFSALPFMIKGIELVQTARVKRGEVVTYHIGNAEIGAAEIWAAECNGEDSFRVLGIIFVTLAITAIVVGVVLEVLASKVMRTRRVEKGHYAEGPFGMAAFDTTAFSLMGTAKQDERDRRMSEMMLTKQELYGSETSSFSDGERRWWRFWRRGERNSTNSRSESGPSSGGGVGQDGLSSAERAMADLGEGYGEAPHTAQQEVDSSTERSRTRSGSRGSQ